MPTVAERSASLEIISKMPILAISRLPIWTKRAKNRILVNVTNKLSKEAFLMSASHLVDIIEIDKKESCKYGNAWEQTYAMLRGEFARFYDQKDVIYQKVRVYRMKIGLTV